MRIALYSRVSTKDERQDVENQLRQLREFCSKQDDWQIIYEFIDHASGKGGDREALKEMFTAASQHKFDLLLFWSLDRLSREGVLETLNYLQRLNGYNVGYRSFSEPFLDSCGIFKDAIISLLATLARQERVRLSERVLAGLERARAQGRVGGRPPLPEKMRSRVLRLRANGASMSQIAAQLHISKMSVSRIIAVAC